MCLLHVMMSDPPPPDFLYLFFHAIYDACGLVPPSTRNIRDSNDTVTKLSCTQIKGRGISSDTRSIVDFYNYVH